MWVQRRKRLRTYSVVQQDRIVNYILREGDEARRLSKNSRHSANHHAVLRDVNRNRDGFLKQRDVLCTGELLVVLRFEVRVKHFRLV